MKALIRKNGVLGVKECFNIKKVCSFIPLSRQEIEKKFEGWQGEVFVRDLPSGNLERYSSLAKLLEHDRI